MMASSPVAGVYDQVIDRESAFEVLSQKAKARSDAEAAAKQAESEAKQRQAQERADRAAAPRRSTRATPVEAAVTSLTRSVANSLGRALVRGILGSLSRGR